MKHGRQRDRAPIRSRAATGLIGFLVAVCGVAGTSRTVCAEIVRIGLLREGAMTGPVYIAQDKGYFAEEGLSAEFVTFDSAQPVAVAVVSGDVDFAVTGLNAAFFTLAAQGALRIIAGYGRESPGFTSQAVVVSDRAYAAGLTSLEALAGHSVALTQIGGTSHYSLGLIAEKYGVPMKSLRVLALQSSPNALSAVAGGQADAGIIPGRYVMASVQRGDLRLLGWVGDETPWQLGAAITAAKTADSRSGEVERFLRAYRRGVEVYHDAFTGPDETRRDGPLAGETIAIIAKDTKEPAAVVAGGIGYIDREARLDVKDVLHQIAWYESQNLIKIPVDGATLIDRRYVVPLP